MLGASRTLLAASRLRRDRDARLRHAARPSRARRSGAAPACRRRPIDPRARGAAYLTRGRAAAPARLGPVPRRLPAAVAGDAPAQPTRRSRRPRSSRSIAKGRVVDVGLAASRQRRLRSRGARRDRATRRRCRRRRPSCCPTTIASTCAGCSRATAARQGRRPPRSWTSSCRWSADRAADRAAATSRVRRDAIASRPRRPRAHRGDRARDDRGAARGARQPDGAVRRAAVEAIGRAQVERARARGASHLLRRRPIPSCGSPRSPRRSQLERSPPSRAARSHELRGRSAPSARGSRSPRSRRSSRSATRDVAAAAIACRARDAARRSRSRRSRSAPVPRSRRRLVELVGEQATRATRAAVCAALGAADGRRMARGSRAGCAMPMRPCARRCADAAARPRRAAPRPAVVVRSAARARPRSRSHGARARDRRARGVRSRAPIRAVDDPAAEVRARTRTRSRALRERGRAPHAARRPRSRCPRRGAGPALVRRPPRSRRARGARRRDPAPRSAGPRSPRSTTSRARPARPATTRPTCARRRWSSSPPARAGGDTEALLDAARRGARRPRGARADRTRVVAGALIPRHDCAHARQPARRRRRSPAVRRERARPRRARRGLRQARGVRAGGLVLDGRRRGRRRRMRRRSAARRLPGAGSAVRSTRIGSSSTSAATTSRARAMAPREVYVGAFAIDRDEVSVAEYRACVAAGACDLDPLIAGDERYIRTTGRWSTSPGSRRGLLPLARRPAADRGRVGACGARRQRPWPCGRGASSSGPRTSTTASRARRRCASRPHALDHARCSSSAIPTTATARAARAARQLPVGRGPVRHARPGRQRRRVDRRRVRPR